MAEHKKRKRSSRPSGDTDARDAKRQATEKSQPVPGWKEAKQHKAANPPFIRELDISYFPRSGANARSSQSNPPAAKYQTTSHSTYILASA